MTTSTLKFNFNSWLQPEYYFVETPLSLELKNDDLKKKYTILKKKHSDLFAEYKTKYNDVMLTLKLIKEGKLDCNAIERSYNLRLEENVILELKQEMKHLKRNWRNYIQRELQSCKCCVLKI